MDKQEFEVWRKHTQKSTKRWTIDPIHNGYDGSDILAHKGGVDGQYYQISQDGLVEVGTYEGAIPHIGEAMFKKVGSVQCENFNDAVRRFFTAIGAVETIKMYATF